MCERIDGRLRRLASEAKAKYKIVKDGLAYQRLGYTKQLVVSELTRVCFFLTAVPNCGINVVDFWPWCMSQFVRLYFFLYDLNSRFQNVLLSLMTSHACILS